MNLFTLCLGSLDDGVAKFYAGIVEIKVLFGTAHGAFLLNTAVFMTHVIQMFQSPK